MNRLKPRFYLGALLLLMLLLLGVGGALAQEPDVQVGDKSVFGGSYVLRAGERLEGDLAVFGGTARIERDATVDGDVAIMGGSAVIDGRVVGDVAIFGGRLRLGDTAVIEGDLAAFGAVDRAPGARVLGRETSQQFRFSVPGFSPPVPPAIQIDRQEPANFLLRLIWGIVRLGLTTVALGALGLVVALFLPQHTRNVAATAGNSPAASVGLGCLTIPAAVAVGIILVITIIGIPIAFILWIVVAVAALFGWVALGLFVGDRLLRMADVRNPRPAAAAAIGTALLTLVSNLIGIVPCIGGLVGLVLGAWGLGAVVLSRGGTQRYPPGASLGPSEPLIGPLDDDDFPPPPPPRTPPPPPSPPPSRGTEALFADLEARSEPPAQPSPPPPTRDQPPAASPPADEENEPPKT